MIVLEVGETDPRARLDKLVLSLLRRAGQTISRATVQRWIEGGRVRVDGVMAKASAAVQAGARVEVDPEAPPPSRAEPDGSIALSVVFEDEHLLVIDKPAGLVMHPGRGHAEGTLVNGLLARDGCFDREAETGTMRPGIVHRLDKGTSGLVVVAKNEATREALKELFARHAIDREYLAIVVGRARDATYDTLHGRHPTERVRFSSRVDRGKRAVTHVRALEELGPATLVACTLETGRTHQIRVHLAERSATPVLGDPLYGKPPKDALLRALGAELGRQALHARVLGFDHPATGIHMRWESQPPPDFRSCLDALRAALATRSST